MLITTLIYFFFSGKEQPRTAACCVTLVIYGSIIPDHPPPLFILSQYHQTFGLVMKIKQRLGNIAAKPPHTPYSSLFLEGERGMLRGIHVQTNSISQCKSNRQNNPNIYWSDTFLWLNPVVDSNQKTLCFLLQKKNFLFNNLTGNNNIFISKCLAGLFIRTCRQPRLLHYSWERPTQISVALSRWKNNDVIFFL